MYVRMTTDPQAFRQAVFPYLQQDPVLHTIIMSNVHERANGTAGAEDEPSYFVSVHDPDVVGVAMARNPVPLIIPCHRVLAAGGKIGGFSAPGGSTSKLRMLELEGVQVGPPPPAQQSLDF